MTTSESLNTQSRANGLLQNFTAARANVQTCVARTSMQCKQKLTTRNIILGVAAFALLGIGIAFRNMNGLNLSNSEVQVNNDPRSVTETPVPSLLLTGQAVTEETGKMNIMGKEPAKREETADPKMTMQQAEIIYKNQQGKLAADLHEQIEEYKKSEIKKIMADRPDITEQEAKKIHENQLSAWVKSVAEEYEQSEIRKIMADRPGITEQEAKKIHENQLSAWVKSVGEEYKQSEIKKIMETSQK